MRQKFGLSIKIICLVLAFCLGSVSIRLLDEHKNKTSNNAPKQKIMQYHGQLLESENLTVITPYVGYITPIHEVAVQPYISGFIKKIYVTGGQFVKKGDVLVELKQDEYIAALHSAYANTLKAKANLQNAYTYYNRIKKAGKSVSPSELEAAEASYLTAKATFQASQADYLSAQVNYDYTIIKAPINGVVGDVALTRGNYVSPSSPPLLNIVQYNPIRVVFSISDKEYLKELQKNKPFDDETLFLKLPNGQIFENTGSFRYTDNSIDKSTTSMAVYADFKNIGKTLTPNAYVTVLSQNLLKNAVAVKKNLVLLANDGNFVYLVRQGKLIKEKVEILASKDENFILKNTFRSGDAIVTDAVNDEALGQPAQILTPQKKA